jgi:hypothetical protein
MKKILYILSITLALCAFTEKVYAQAASTQGKDFWLSFGKNRNYASSVLNLQVRIVAAQDAAVTFTYTESGDISYYSVSAGEVKTITLNPDERDRVYSDNVGYTGTSKKSLHIESDVPISVYALNQRSHTTDATNVLPINSLGTSYYHISYKGFTSYNDGFTAIATEDNTVITENGVAHPYTLQKGDVFSVYFNSTDRTGMDITSNHPIAYFVTNGGVYVPIDTGDPDMLFQQLLPVSKWGTNFLVPVTNREVERIRIVASQNGTAISQTGGIITTDDGGYSTGSLTLNKGQFVELETTLSSCGCYISSNKPVGVCTYLVGMNHPLQVGIGDPAMTWVSPIEQSISGVLIAPFIPDGTTALSEHYVLLVTPTATKNQTTMAIGTDAATSLTGGNWCDNTVSNHSFYSLLLDEKDKSYYFTNPHGLLALGYGIGSAESYYYLSGAAARNLDAYFSVNDIYYEDLSLSGETFCDTTINLKATVQYANSSVSGYLKWYIDGVEKISVRDILAWDTIMSSGSHSVKLVVLDMEGNYISMFTEFNVGVSYHNTIDTVIYLGDAFIFGGFDTVPTQTGFINLVISDTTAMGCDSITTLNLLVIKPLAKQYIACPNAVATIGFTNMSGVTYTWYGTQSGGTAIYIGNTMDVVKNYSPIQEWWVEAVYNGIVFPRIHVNLEASANCGSTNPSECAASGTLLFREDFGGNNVSDLAIKPTGIPQVVGYTYNTTLNGNGVYVIAKQNPYTHSTWYVLNDHTFAGNTTRGYLIAFDASVAAGQFYEYQINDLCAGSKLYFSAWLASLINNLTHADRANLIFLLEDTEGNVLASYYTGNLPDADPNWKIYGFEFTIPAQKTSVVLKIINNGTGSSGNDFVMDDIEIRLCAPPVTISVTNSGNACVGDSVQFTGNFVNDGTFTEPLEYKWFKSSTADINNPASWTALSATSLVLKIPSATASDEGYYRLAVSGTGNINNENCRAMNMPIHLTINQLYNDTIYIEACGSGSYTENGFNIIISNPMQITQTHTNLSVNSCDSLFTVNFTVYPEHHDTIRAGICLGDSYNYYDFNVTPAQSGTSYYSRNSVTTNGCDSITVLELLVRPSYHDTVIAKICVGETYNATAIGLNYITPADTGTYYYTKNYYTAIYYCDSIKILQLTVNPVYDTTINATICLGEKYDLYNFDITPTHAGTANYTQNLPTISGCDSIITLNLKVNPVYDTLTTAAICLGDRYKDDNFDTIPTQAGTVNYSKNPKTVNDCDSIIRLELIVYPSYHNIIKEAICVNEYYTENGFYVAPSQAGVFTYTHDFKTDKNCDSIIALELTVNPVFNISIHDTIYEDEYYKVGNYQYNTPGLHTSNLQTLAGCDSIINLTLDVIYYPPEITAFSPFNEDGINDYFMAGFKIQVFNRYGQLIYETKTKEQQDLGWDGRNTKGNKVETGLYFYILYNTSGKPIIKSSVELLKR